MWFTQKAEVHACMNSITTTPLKQKTKIGLTPLGDITEQYQLHVFVVYGLQNNMEYVYIPLSVLPPVVLKARHLSGFAFYKDHNTHAHIYVGVYI